jgi:hypothetical protein
MSNIAGKTEHSCSSYCTGNCTNSKIIKYKLVNILDKLIKNTENLYENASTENIQLIDRQIENMTINELKELDCDDLDFKKLEFNNMKVPKRIYDIFLKTIYEYILRDSY